MKKQLRMLKQMGGSFNGRTLGLQPGNRGSNPRRSTDMEGRQPDTAGRTALLTRFSFTGDQGSNP